MGGDSVPSSRGAFSLSGGANGGASAEPACGRARSVVTLIVPDPVDLTVPRRGMEWMRPGQAPSRGCTCTARGEGGRNVSRSKHWSKHRGTRTNDALAKRKHHYAPGNRECLYPVRLCCSEIYVFLSYLAVFSCILIFLFLGFPFYTARGTCE